MSKIELGKQYVDENNLPVRVLCVDRPVPGWPVVIMKASGNLCVLTEDGTNPVAQVSIKEYDPLDEVRNLPVDAPIWVRIPSTEWTPRHFSHVSDGKVCTWDRGQTSHTGSTYSKWKEWSINKPKELT